MALVNINIGRKALQRLIAVLGRIADALDRAYPIPVESGKGEPREDNLTIVTDDTLWEQEQEAEREKQQGLPETAA